MDNLKYSSKEEEKFAQIESQIEVGKGKVKNEVRESIAYLVLVVLGGLLIGLHYSEVLVLGIFLQVIVWMLSILFLFALIGSEVAVAKSELLASQAIKNVMLKLPNHDSTTHYFDSLVDINVENLSAYYSTIKIHTQLSFRVSIMAGTVGFVLIIVGLVLGFQNENMERLSYIATATGVIVEFISGVLFFLYNKTVRQLKEYHDSLINVQNILLSFKLIESTKDEKEKNEMINKMIRYLVSPDN